MRVDLKIGYSYLCKSSCLVWSSFSPWDVAISPASYLTLLKQRHRICRVWPGLLMWFQAEGCQAVRACASSENWYETTQVESCVIFNTRSEVIFKMRFLRFYMVYLWFIDIQWRQFREVFWGLVWRSIEKDLKGWWCQDSIPQSHRDSGRKKREALRIRLFRIDLSGVFWGFWAAHKYVS